MGHRKRAKAPEVVDGLFFSLPHKVLDSPAWQGCSAGGRGLLTELGRQLNGSNNGYLHLSRQWLASRGWRRPATVRKLRDELIRRRLIIQTRHGGLNNGAHRFAVTWLDISDFSKIDIRKADYQRNAYLLEPLPEPINSPSRAKQNGWTAYVLAKAPVRTPVRPPEVAPKDPLCP